jgi:5-methylcytosine-specific restriction enzyme A
MGIRALYNTRRWFAARFMAKRRDGFACTECGARGRLEVHHVRMAKDHPEFFDLSNLKTLCVACHVEKTRKERGHDDPKRRAWRDLLRGRTDVGIREDRPAAV